MSASTAVRIVAPLVALLAAFSAARGGEREVWFGVVLGQAPGPGVAVLYPVEGGPAQVSGIVAGDRIVRVDAADIRTAEDLGAALSRHAPGDEIAVLLRRGADEKTVRVQLAPRDLAARARSAYDLRRGLPRFRLGYTASAITPELRRHYGAPADRGVLVTGVEEGTLASRLGLAVGDVVTEVGSRPVDGPAELQSALSVWRAPDPIQVQLIRAGERRTLTAEPESVAPDPPAAPEAPWVLGTPRALSDQERLKHIARLEAEIARLESRTRELRERVRRLERESEDARRNP